MKIVTVKAIKLDFKIDFKFGKVIHLLNFGKLLNKKGRTVAALKILEKSLETSQEIGSKEHTADILCTIGQIYLGMCDYDSALKYYVKSPSIYQELKLKKNETYRYYRIGLIYMDKMEWTQAIKNLKTTSALFIELGIKNSSETMIIQNAINHATDKLNDRNV